MLYIGLHSNYVFTYETPEYVEIFVAYVNHDSKDVGCVTPWMLYNTFVWQLLLSQERFYPESSFSR